jgi:RimJ/RimL family protein N-acetyltransferase
MAKTKILLNPVILSNKLETMLTGEKVTLRAMRRDDLERLCQFNNDVEVELAGGGDPPIPQSLARLQAEFDANVGKGGRDGTSWAIEANGVFIGQCALFGFDEVARHCGLGITIGDKAYWGAGYGRDAVRLMLDYAFRLRNLNRVWLSVLGNNERAIRAYSACGFVVEGRQRQHAWCNGGYVDLVLMGALREEWAGAASLLT